MNLEYIKELLLEKRQLFIIVALAIFVTIGIFGTSIWVASQQQWLANLQASFANQFDGSQDGNENTSGSGGVSGTDATNSSSSNLVPNHRSAGPPPDSTPIQLQNTSPQPAKLSSIHLRGTQTNQVTFTANARPNSSFVARWQSADGSASNRNGQTNVSGATNGSFTIPNNLPLNTEFAITLCENKNGACGVTSNTLYVKRTGHLPDGTICTSGVECVIAYSYR